MEQHQCFHLFYFILHFIRKHQSVQKYSLEMWRSKVWAVQACGWRSSHRWHQEPYAELSWEDQNVGALKVLPLYWLCFCLLLMSKKLSWKVIITLCCDCFLSYAFWTQFGCRAFGYIYIFCFNVWMIACLVQEMLSLFSSGRWTVVWNMDSFFFVGWECEPRKMRKQAIWGLQSLFSIQLKQAVSSTITKRDFFVQADLLRHVVKNFVIFPLLGFCSNALLPPTFCVNFDRHYWKSDPIE